MAKPKFAKGSPYMGGLSKINAKTKKISSIFFVFFLYDILFIKSPISFIQNIIGVRYLVNYTLSLIVLLLFIFILENLFKRNLFFKVLATVLFVLPLGIQTAHYAFYSMPINAYGIRFFLHEPVLTTSLALENINYIKLILFFLFSLFVLYLFLKPESSWSKERVAYFSKDPKFQNTKLFSLFLLYVPLVILCGVNWYLILDYQHPMVSVYGSLPEVGRSYYFKKLKAHKPQIILPPATKPLPNILWIIGESVTKSHMSLYGYPRKTTPNLDELRDKGQLIPFQNVVSIGPHTIISVPYMMVGLQNIDPTGKIYSTPNIFEYAKVRGYETAFISAQDLRWRNFDQLVGGNGVVDFFRSGPDFSPNVSVAKGADDLKVLDNSILPHLNQLRTPFLLVAHMDGSHYPYNLHSEPQYKKFLPEGRANGVNAYDNTVVYSDIYLSKLIAAARAKDPNIWIFYTTDHGQPVSVPSSFTSPEFLASEKDEGESKSSLLDFSEWRKKIAEIFEQNSSHHEESKIIFNQGFGEDIIHNAFFVVPPAEYEKQIHMLADAPVAQSDIFATILNLMDVRKPLAPIDGLSLLKPIPVNRMRISTGYVVTNDNVPEAQVVYPDFSSVFVDFSRKSVSIEKSKQVMPFDQSPIEIQKLFNEP